MKFGKQLVTQYPKTIGPAVKSWKFAMEFADVSVLKWQGFEKLTGTV